MRVSNLAFVGCAAVSVQRLRCSGDFRTRNEIYALGSYFSRQSPFGTAFLALDLAISDNILYRAAASSMVLRSKFDRVRPIFPWCGAISVYRRR